MKVLQIIFINSLLLLLITPSLIAQIEEFRVEHSGDDVKLLLGLPNQMACIENIIDTNNANNYLSLRAINDPNAASIFLGSNGYIVVGTDDPCDRVPSVQAIFNVDGNFYVEGETYKENGNTFFTIISDKRLKKNIQPLEKQTSLAKLNAIKVYDFEYKDSGIQRSGIMAQEIKKILPRTVNTFEKSGTEFYNFNPNDLFYTHINATQELSHIISQQEKELTQLKQDNQVIKDKLNQTVQTLIAKEDKLNQAVQAYEGAVEKLMVTKTKLNDLESKYQTLVQQMELVMNTLNMAEDKSQDAKQSIEPTVRKQEHNRLEQNIPNPTSNETMINYYLTGTTTNAYLTISNVEGQVIKQYPLTTKGAGQIVIQLKDLQIKGGLYYYNLVVDGESVDSKKMILVQ